jgi:hypothetical protein
MSISHVSVAVNDPERAARALAEIWRGSAYPFFPIAGAWIVFSGRDPASQIEFYPAGSELAPADDDIDYELRYRASASSFTPTHVAIKAPCDRTLVEQIAVREGWRCRVGDRGGAFKTLDLWIDDRVLIEVMTPDLQPDFDRAMNAERWVSSR